MRPMARVLLIASGLCSVSLIVLTAIDALTFHSVFQSLLCIPLCAVHLLLTAVSGVYAIFSWIKQKNRLAGLIPMLNLISLLVVWKLPRIVYVWDLDLRLQLAGYNRIIRLVEDGIIQADDHGFAELPPKYRNLSANGIIRIHRGNGMTSILFWRSTGILGEGSAYVYSPDGRSPSYEVYCDRLSPASLPHWYRCESY